MGLGLRSEYGCPKSSKGCKSRGQSEAYGSQGHSPHKYPWLLTYDIYIYVYIPRKGTIGNHTLPDPEMDPVLEEILAEATDSRNRKNPLKHG